MNEPDGLTVLADEFDRWVWDFTTHDLREREGEWRDRCARCKVGLDRVLAEQSDEALALAVQKQFCAKEAFVELFVKRLGGDLLRWFRGWERGCRRDYHHELDLAQIVCLEFLARPEKLGTYDPNKTYFVHWLRVVARNLWISRVHRSHQPLPTDLPPEPVEWLTPDQEVMADELRSRLDTAILRLPAAQRAVMELSAQGLGPGEVAGHLGWPIRRVYRLLCKARQAIVEQLSLELPPSSRGRPKKQGSATTESELSDN